MQDSSFRGPVFQNVRLEWPKTPVLCGRKAETEDKTPSSETSGYEWLGPESESRERSYCSLSTELPLFLFQWTWLSSAFVAESCPLSFMCLFRRVLLAAPKGHTMHPSGLEWTIIWRWRWSQAKKDAPHTSLGQIHFLSTGFSSQRPHPGCLVSCWWRFIASPSPVENGQPL